MRPRECIDAETLAAHARECFMRARSSTRWLNALSIVIGLTSGTTLAGNMVISKSDGVTVHEDSSKSATVVATLKKDQALESIERKGMYWKVKTADGKTGFVSVMQVSQKAESASSGLTKALRDAVVSDRDVDDVVGARSRAAVMGVRGLSDSDDVDFAGSVRPNLRLVYAMEDISISKKVLTEHQKLMNAEIEAFSRRKGQDSGEK